MQVIINGEQTRLEPGLTVQGLIEQLAVEGKLAVEINEEIVPRSHFPQHRLNEGDRIEIVRAIGGG